MSDKNHLRALKYMMVQLREERERHARKKADAAAARARRKTMARERSRMDQGYGIGPFQNRDEERLEKAEEDSNKAAEVYSERMKNIRATIDAMLEVFLGDEDVDVDQLVIRDWLNITCPDCGEQCRINNRIIELVGDEDSNNG